MSTTAIIDKITADAQKQAEAIRADAAAEVEAIERATKDALATLRAEAAAELAKQKEQMELVATAKAKQQGKLQVQKVKRAALDGIFSSAYDEIVALPSAEYVHFFTTFAKERLPQTLTATSVAVPHKRVEETERILKALSLNTEVTKSDTLAAGFVITAADGIYDLSFDRAFALARPELEMRIMQEHIK